MSKESINTFKTVSGGMQLLRSSYIFPRTWNNLDHTKQKIYAAKVYEQLQVLQSILLVYEKFPELKKSSQSETSVIPVLGARLCR